MKSCYYITVTGHPAISVPCGFTPEGLPVGVQIVGRHRDDFGVLQLAHAFEQATRVGNAGRRWSVVSGQRLALFDGGLSVGEEETSDVSQPEQQRTWTVAEAQSRLRKSCGSLRKRGHNISARTGHSSSCPLRGGTPTNNPVGCPISRPVYLWVSGWWKTCRAGLTLNSPVGAKSTSSTRENPFDLPHINRRRPPSCRHRRLANTPPRELELLAPWLRPI